MLPAYESFKSPNMARLQIDDWLIVKQKFVAFYCAPEIGLELQQIQRSRVHGFVENLVPVFTQHLGAVHRRIRVAQYVVWMFVTNCAERNTNADCGEDFPSIQTKRGRKRGLQPVSNLDSF